MTPLDFYREQHLHTKNHVEPNLQSVKTVAASQSRTIRSKSNLFANRTEILRRQERCGGPHVRFIAFAMRSNCVIRSESGTPTYSVS